MTERPRNEKDEKDEKNRNESWDEKWRRDPVEAITWALILMWAGVVWLLDNAGLWAKVLPEGSEPWAIGLAGAGLIVLLGVVLRLVVPAYRRPVIGSIIFGVVLLVIGLGQFVEWNWPVVGAILLIGIGAALLLSGLFRKKQ